MRFELSAPHLLELLEAEEPCGAEVLRLVDAWAGDYDRGDKADPEDGCNLMHLVGAALCVLLHKSKLGADFDLRTALGSASGRVLLCDKRLADHDIEELQNLVTALQLEFRSLYTLDETGPDAGCWALVDTEAICVRIMAQLGALLLVAERTQGTEPSTAAVRGLVDVDSGGFCSVRTETFVFVLDAIHSMYCLHALLTRACFIAAAPEHAEVHAHHREASNETFFLHSTTSDCVVGSIAQYAHRFSHLFHSVSQAIYYNHPSYTRQTQLPLAELQRAHALAVNLLPLLTELRPDIPVLFEHTGAGCRAEHAKHPWSWVLWSHFVLLVDADMRSFIANDLRTLLSHAS
jgi:hypothetical protein